jgi:hypothetical protein
MHHFAQVVENGLREGRCLRDIGIDLRNSACCCPGHRSPPDTGLGDQYKTALRRDSASKLIAPCRRRGGQASSVWSVSADERNLRSRGYHALPVGFAEAAPEGHRPIVADEAVPARQPPARGRRAIRHRLAAQIIDEPSALRNRSPPAQGNRTISGSARWCVKSELNTTSDGLVYENASPVIHVMALLAGVNSRAARAA